MPPTRVNKLPKSYKTPQSQTHCAKGHVMDDAYISYNRYGAMRRRCATCQKDTSRAIHRRRMRNDPIYAGSRRVGWEVFEAAKKAEAARLRAELAAKRAANG
jgi:hypothetical protein